MGGQVGGISLGAVPGAFIVGVLLLGAILSTIVIVQRSRVRVLDVTEQTYDDVGTGLALLERRVAGLAAALTELRSCEVREEAAGLSDPAPAMGVADAAATTPTHVSDAPPAPAIDTVTDLELAGLALEDARERLDAAAALRASSPSLPVSRRCRHLLLEGLAAVHFGYEAAGREPGPIPPPPTAAPLVESPVRVRVGDAEHVALPAYAPGYRCCYSGGLFDVAEVPGGWYADPFWEDLLAAGAPTEG